MGLFRLIEQRKFQEFCHLYEEKVEIRDQNPEFADLIPGQLYFSPARTERLSWSC